MSEKARAAALPELVSLADAGSIDYGYVAAAVGQGGGDGDADYAAADHDDITRISHTFTTYRICGCRHRPEPAQPLNSF